MKRPRFSERRIVEILEEADAGTAPAEICRKHGISEATYYAWKARLGWATASQQRRLRELEAENASLRNMYLKLSLEHNALQEAVRAVTTRHRPQVRGDARENGSSKN
ncbi:MAG TPA: transposase [Burkholderiales bacterium]|nr:transposase [Burkholderiales bacterium]